MSNSETLDTAKSDLAARRQEFDAVERRLAWVGNTRFILAMACLAIGFAAMVKKVDAAAWLPPPLLAFVALSWVSERLNRRRRRIVGVRRFLEHVIARMEDHWAGSGFAGGEYLPADHPCAADLDLFGKGSLYERICLATTRAGRDTLAAWMLHPARPQEIIARQEAVRELSQRSDWRLRSFLLGSSIPRGINTTALAAWGKLSGKAPGLPRVIAPALIGLSALGVAGWLLEWLPPTVIVVFLLIQGGFAVGMMPRVRQALHGLERRSHDLFQLVELLTAIERETFVSPLLKRWQHELSTSSGQSPSQSLRRLTRFIDLLDQRHNVFFAIVAPFMLWTTQLALAIESWRRAAGEALGRWTKILGEMEAITSIAGYAAENRDDVFPEVIDGPALFEARGLGHPLLPRARSVANDLTLDSRRRLLVISGSNMSGKSTLLRAAGVNTVLAQMGAPVRAASLRLSRLAIGATLHVQDSLQQGRSRFYAEIMRLQQILELAKGPLPVLFLLDEILHGTNSHDRRIGAEAVVRELLDRPTIGLVTTHDLALTQLADGLEPLAANAHFEDDFRDGQMHFDYRLKPGPIERGNALALMRAIGLNVADDR